MRPVSDEFLLTLATIAATLIGLLLLGGFFYLETGFRRATTVAQAGAPYLRATIRFTLVLYSWVLGLALALVVLRPGWLAAAYAALTVLVVVSLVDWTRSYRALRQVIPVPRESLWITWPAIVVMLVLPWALDGWDPSRESVMWTLLLAGILAVASTASLLLTSFELSRWEDVAQRSFRPDDGPPPVSRG